jgi:hypothetical protein
MARLFFLRIYLRLASAVGLLSLAFFLISLDPFLSAAPFDASGMTSAVKVNRALKGDRLPLFDPDVSGQRGVAPVREFGAGGGLHMRGKIPIGCDHAFSPVSAPSLSDVYGRCTV